MQEFTQEKVNELRKEAEEAYLIYANLKEQYLSAERDWLKKSRRFKDADYKKALVDGRLRKIPPSMRKEDKKVPELTLEQLQSIAARLGINITVDEPVMESEEVIESMEGLND